MRDYEHCETDRLVEPKWPQAGRIVAAFGLEPDASLGGCPMTHMDDQLAKHIKEMIRKITRKPTDNQEPPRSPEPTRPDRSYSPAPSEPSL
jgi:hypothetical protein